MPLPERSFFLFGPRGTGKTTWLRSVLADAHWISLATDRELVRLTRDPGQLSREVSALPARTWVVIDEIQRVPALLGEIQELIASQPGRHRFALTGSSARKLRREGGNLLPARLINRRFAPLVAAEIGREFDLGAALRFGTLPAVQSERRAEDKIDLLEAYVENYLTQEIRHEAIVKRLDTFTRFLEVATLANGQITNVAAIARDAAVARPTVQGYFEVLVDTLIGSWLPAWRPRAKVKEVAHPKFYFFDPGVVRAIHRRLHDPLVEAEKGPLLETYLLHEVRSYMDRKGLGGQLAYWRTPSGSEVDLIWTRGSRAVGMEIKSASRWRREDGAALEELLAAKMLTRGFGVYCGGQALKAGEVHVLPVASFLKQLESGELLG